MYLQLAWLDWMEFDRWGMNQRYLSRKLEFLELAFDAYSKSGNVDTNVEVVIIYMLIGIMEHPKGKFHARAVSFMQQVRQLYGSDKLPKIIRFEFSRYDKWYAVRLSVLFSVSVTIPNRQGRDDEKPKAGTTDAGVPSAGSVRAEEQSLNSFLYCCELCVH